MFGSCMMLVQYIKIGKIGMMHGQDYPKAEHQNHP